MAARARRPMPHYVLDARTATPHFPGIGRYVANLARALGPRLTSGERLTILYHPEHPLSLVPQPGVTLVSAAVSPFSLAQQTRLPRLLPRPPGRPLPQRLLSHALSPRHPGGADGLRPDPAALARPEHGPRRPPLPHVHAPRPARGPPGHRHLRSHPSRPARALPAGLRPPHHHPVGRRPGLSTRAIR